MKMKKNYKAGDICFYDRETNMLIIVPFNEWNIKQYPSSRFAPIGVVVIPSSHDVYGNGQCGIMSLKEMNCTTPDEGSTIRQGICWGQYNFDTYLQNLNVGVVTGTTAFPTAEATGKKAYSYLPSDDFTNTQCPTDPLAHYRYKSTSYFASPSPYLEDESRNSVYYQTKKPSYILNCLADFDGVGNTEVLCELATSQPDWKTDDTIAESYNSGYSPAACCCWRFHTEGTKQGDWYLPACGELGYMMVRLKTINNTIENLINAYGSDVGVSVSTSYLYWSSSEYSSNYARDISPSSGDVDGGNKSSNYYVRAFMKVKNQNIDGCNSIIRQRNNRGIDFETLYYGNGALETLGIATKIHNNFNENINKKTKMGKCENSDSTKKEKVLENRKLIKNHLFSGDDVITGLNELYNEIQLAVSENKDVFVCKDGEGKTESYFSTRFPLFGKMVNVYLFIYKFKDLETFAKHNLLSLNRRNIFDAIKNEIQFTTVFVGNVMYKEFRYNRILKGLVDFYMGCCESGEEIVNLEIARDLIGEATLHAAQIMRESTLDNKQEYFANGIIKEKFASLFMSMEDSNIAFNIRSFRDDCIANPLLLLSHNSYIENRIYIYKELLQWFKENQRNKHVQDMFTEFEEFGFDTENLFAYLDHAIKNHEKRIDSVRRFIFMTTPLFELWGYCGGKIKTMVLNDKNNTNENN